MSPPYDHPTFDELQEKVARDIAAKAQRERYADAGEELVAALKDAWAFLATMPVEQERKQEHYEVAERCRNAILKVKGE